MSADPGCPVCTLSLQLLGLEEWNWGRLFWGRGEGSPWGGGPSPQNSEAFSQKQSVLGVRRLHIAQTENRPSFQKAAKH